MREVLNLINDFRTDRPTMDENNTVERLLELLEGELDEAKTASKEELASEVADVVIYGLTLLQALVEDPEEELKAKVAYNHCQHPAGNYQHGDFEISRHNSKKFVADRGFRDQFYSQSLPDNVDTRHRRLNYPSYASTPPWQSSSTPSLEPHLF